MHWQRFAANRPLQLEFRPVSGRPTDALPRAHLSRLSRRRRRPPDIRCIGAAQSSGCGQFAEQSGAFVAAGQRRGIVVLFTLAVGGGVVVGVVVVVVAAAAAAATIS